MIDINDIEDTPVADPEREKMLIWKTKNGSCHHFSFQYDNLYQLTFVDYNNGSQTRYDYDLLGNRTTVVNGGTTNYESNRLNQYTKVNETDFTYEKNGNLTYDGQQRYYYDCENRLTEVQQGENTVAEYKYDFAGRRVAKTVGSTTKTFIYDGDQVIVEYDNGVLKSRYFYGPGIDEPICMMQGFYAYYYHLDGLGSVIALSNSSGQLLEKYKYDAFGNPTILSPTDELRSASAYSNRFMFTGREYDSETGNYYYRARYYSPKLGRFLQTDPVGYNDSLNIYQYCLNNPLNYWDPYGLYTYRVRRKTVEIVEPNTWRAHEYIVVVDENGTFVTFSYTGPDKRNAIWKRNYGPDVNAAWRAYMDKDRYLERIGDSRIDKHIKDEFAKREGTHSGFNILFNNCQDKSRELQEAAKKALENSEASSEKKDSETK